MIHKIMQDRTHSQRGVSFIFLSIGLVVLILLIGFGFGIGYHLTVKAQAQSLADSIAHASTQALDHTPNGFIKSAAYAKDLINLALRDGLIYGTKGEELIINSDFGGTSANNTYEFESEHLHAKLEIGIWINRSFSSPQIVSPFAEMSDNPPPQADYQYESMDDSGPIDDGGPTLTRPLYAGIAGLEQLHINFNMPLQNYNEWSLAHPQLPYSLIANAIKVTITVNDALARFSSITSYSSSLSATAIAAHDTTKSPVVAPPFAISICGLNANGESTQESSREIYFSGASRNPNPFTFGTKALPNFDWDPNPLTPCSMSLPDGVTLSSPVNCSLSPASASDPLQVDTTIDNACFWSTPHSDIQLRNFGFIGLPVAAIDSETGITEQSLNDYLNCQYNNSCTTGLVIGDGFKLIPEVGNSSELNNTVWRLITEPPSNDNNSKFVGDYKSFSKTDLFPMNKNNNWAYMNPQYTNVIDYGATCLQSSPASIDPSHFWMSYNGACNSMRSGFGFWNKWHTETNDCEKGYATPSSELGEPFTSMNVWETMVAVIADASSNAHSCDNLGMEDLANEKVYTIVGFIPVYIYDVDIANDAPTFPHTCSYYPNKDTSNSIANWGNSNPNSTFYPWGFLNADATSGKCNLIRARPVAASAGKILWTAEKGDRVTIVR